MALAAAAVTGLLLAGEPIRVGGSQQQAKLTRKVQPVYPPEAKQNKLSGKVELEAVIATDGAVKQVRVLSGKSPLTEAAAEAVRQWTYEPTLLNGEPVEVITEITVNFSLSK